MTILNLWKPVEIWSENQIQKIFQLLETNSNAADFLVQIQLHTCSEDQLYILYFFILLLLFYFTMQLLSFIFYNVIRTDFEFK